VLREIGRYSLQIGEEVLLFLGSSARNVGGALWGLFEPPFPKGEIVKEIFRSGVESGFIIGVTGLFTGMVLALQGAVTLDRFGARSLIGNAITATLLKELGPSLSALLVAGRVGSGYASEVGTMMVTEQIDALRAMGFDPRKYVFLPRLIAIASMTPVLSIYFSTFGLLGGLFVAIYDLHFSYTYYLQSVQESLRLADIFGGIFKSFVFGFLIGTISLTVGLRTRGGSEAVGVSTRLAVVASSVTVLISDFFLARVLVRFG